MKESQGRQTEDRTGGSLCRAGRNSVARTPNRFRTNVRTIQIPGPITQTCLLTPFLDSSRSWDRRLGVETLVSGPPTGQEMGWALGGSRPGGRKSPWRQGSCGGGGDGRTVRRERHREVFLGWTGEREEMETRFLWGQRPLHYFHGVRLEFESQAVQCPPRTRILSLCTYLLRPY